MSDLGHYRAHGGHRTCSISHLVSHRSGTLAATAACCMAWDSLSYEYCFLRMIFYLPLPFYYKSLSDLNLVEYYTSAISRF